jgi:hypothetical protein
MQELEEINLVCALIFMNKITQLTDERQKSIDILCEKE